MEFFYFSPSQYRLIHNPLSYKPQQHRCFARDWLTGRIVEYTEAARWPWRKGAWRDYKLVAVGWYHHSQK